ncbi:hypothetical protein GFS60_03500 [Rhodococcus sp. WAY2]|nr:hypothetical protein GFS60_03500 [Rhodococcus sp. WAY2]
MLVHTEEPDNATQDSLDLLASWAATLTPRTARPDPARA